MQTKKAIEDNPDEILVHADSGTAKANVTAFLQDSGYQVSVDQDGEEYRIKGTRS